MRMVVGLLFVFIDLRNKCEMSSFIRSKDVILSQNLEMGHVILTTPFGGHLVKARLMLCMVNSCTKLDVSSFSRSRDISGGAKF